MRLSIKSLMFVSFAIIFLTLLFQDAFCAETEFYCEQVDGSKFYYDKDNIVYSSGKVRLWNSVVLSDIGREYVKKNADVKGIDPYKILTYNEVDCKQRNFRILSVILCGETKSFLRKGDDVNRLIVNNTCPEELFDIICKKRK